MAARILRLSVAVSFSILCSVQTGSASPADSLDILFTGGFRGRVNGCSCPGSDVGGLARRHTVVRSLYGDKAPLALDAGRFLDLDPAGGKAASFCSLAGLANLGLKVAVVTARDLFYGVDFLRKVSEDSGIEFLSANLVDQETGEPLFKAITSFRADKWNVQVVALIQHMPGKRFPGLATWATVPPDLAFTSLKDSLSDSTDLTVLLTDLSEKELRLILPQLPEVDLAVTSSRQVYTPSPFEVASTMIIHPQASGVSVDGVKIVPGEFKSGKAAYFSFPVTRSIKPDEQKEIWIEECLKESH